MRKEIKNSGSQRHLVSLDVVKEHRVLQATVGYDDTAPATF